MADLLDCHGQPVRRNADLPDAILSLLRAIPQPYRFLLVTAIGADITGHLAGLIRWASTPKVQWIEALQTAPLPIVTPLPIGPPCSCMIREGCPPACVVDDEKKR